MTGDVAPEEKVAINASEDERKLFVGGLPNETKHEDIKLHFGKFGVVEKVKLMSDQVFTIYKDMKTDALCICSFSPLLVFS